MADLLDEIVEKLPPPSRPRSFLKTCCASPHRAAERRQVLDAQRGFSEERVVVSPIPGTTRDTVDTYFERNGQRYVLVDTAGIRRPGKVQGSVDTTASCAPAAPSKALTWPSWCSMATRAWWTATSAWVAWPTKKGAPASSPS